MSSTSVNRAARMSSSLARLRSTVQRFVENARALPRIWDHIEHPPDQSWSIQPLLHPHCLRDLGRSDVEFRACLDVDGKALPLAYIVAARLNASALRYDIAS